MKFEFVDAVKEQEKARISIEGPSGSGKTWSALAIAQGLGQRIALIDTERRSARKYSGVFAFKTISMYTFDPLDLVEALATAAAARFDVVIIDSLSHFWMGTDGILEKVDQAARRSPSGNSWGAWKDVTPVEKTMINAMLSFPGHLIATMRVKSDYVVSDNDRGKKEPKKIGLKPQQREGIEYEFDVVGALDQDHNFTVAKSRIPDIADKVINKPGIELGAEILTFLNDGTIVPSVQDYIDRARDAATLEVLRGVFDEVNERGIGPAPCAIDGRAMSLSAYILGRRTELTPPAQPKQPQPQAPAQQNGGRAPRMATPEQKQELAILIGQKLGITVRTERLAAMGAWLGRVLGSFDDLRYIEAAGALHDLKGRDDHVPPGNPELVESLRTSVAGAPLEELDQVMHTATDARDDGKLTADEWQQISDLVDARASALLADKAAERDWTPEAAQAPEAVVA